MRSASGICVLLLISFSMAGVARAAEDAIVSLAIGDEHSCALRRSGTVACWGRNFSGQLGDGTRQDRSTPAAVVGLDGVRQIAAFGARTCAVRRDGAVLCWGHVDGLLGHAPSGGEPESWDATTPRPVEGLGEVAEVALGGEHLCARDQGGAVRCWGRNGHGQLGDGSRATRHAPVRVAGLPAARGLALGASHSCALVDDGGVWCWGANEGGQLGDSATADRARAAPIRDFVAVAQLGASGSSTCARLVNGTVRCWGWNSDGQLGNGTTRGHALPKAVRGLEHIVELALGAATACARRVDGTVACWGDEAIAPHGADDEHRSLFPRDQPDLARVTSLARAGQNAGGHSCVVERGAVVRCWGPNAYGQLGGEGSPSRLTLSPTPPARAAR